MDAAIKQSGKAVLQGLLALALDTLGREKYQELIKDMKSDDMERKKLALAKLMTPLTNRNDREALLLSAVDELLLGKLGN
jgi:hypothetical protein